MKLFILIESYSDDDGNFGSFIHSTHKTKEEALEELKKHHDNTVENFNEPDDTYEDGDEWFDISEADDIEIRNECHIEEINID